MRARKDTTPYHIRIVGWDDYNPKNETKKKRTWVRLDCGIWTNRKFMMLTDCSKLVYMLLLCRSVDGEGLCTCSPQVVTMLLGGCHVDVRTLLKKLHEIQLIEILNIAEISPTRRDETNETNETRRVVKEENTSNGLSADAPHSEDAFSLVVQEKKKAKPASDGKTKPTWEAYTETYLSTYGVKPVRNARVNKQMVDFVNRVPLEDAPLIAAHYVRSKNQYYLSRGHSVGIMLADAEKLATEARRGVHMTNTRANQLDTADANKSAFAVVNKLLKQGAENGTCN